MKRITLALIALALLILGSVVAFAAEKPGGPFTVVTSEELKAMIDRNEPGMVLIDTRSSEEYQEAHIKGAVNIPWSRLEKDKSALAFPKGSKLLFYCSGLA